MYLTDDSQSTTDLQNAIALSPYSKPAVSTFLNIYKSAKGFLDARIFLEMRKQVEHLINSPLNLRKSLDRAKMGRLIAIAELTHRRALPSGFEPLHLLGEETEQLEIDFPETPSDNYYPDARRAVASAHQDTPSEKSCSCQVEQLNQLQQECEKERAMARRYQQQLQEFEKFTQFLLLGRIFPAPVETNGLEDAPLLQVFGGARSLSEVHSAYRELRKAWHPDISPYSESETNARFHWLKQAYTTLVNNWSRFDPQNPDIPQERIDKLKAQKLRWTPESFWYW